VRKHAVVVGEGDEIGLDVPDCCVPGAREATRGAQPDDVELTLLSEDRLEPIVLVLVDEEHAKVAVRLRRQRGKQPLELADTVDGRDDEVK